MHWPTWLTSEWVQAGVAVLGLVVAVLTFAATVFALAFAVYQFRRELKLWHDERENERKAREEERAYERAMRQEDRRFAHEAELRRRRADAAVRCIEAASDFIDAMEKVTVRMDVLGWSRDEEHRMQIIEEWRMEMNEPLAAFRSAWLGSQPYLDVDSDGFKALADLWRFSQRLARAQNPFAIDRSDSEPDMHGGRGAEVVALIRRQRVAVIGALQPLARMEQSAGGPADAETALRSALNDEKAPPPTT